MKKSEKQEASHGISAAAQMLGISVRMLREYERRGLIEPYRDPANNYRLFSKADLDWIRCIRELIHNEGLNIKGIQRMLAIMPCWEIKGCPQKKRRTCRASINRRLPCWSLAEKSCQDANKCRICKVYLEAQKKLR